MNRWLPAPRLSALLWVMWLLLNQSVALGDVLLGALLAVLIPMWLRPLLPVGVSIHKPWVIIQLIAAVLVEILRSCYNVSRIILFTKNRQVNSQFMTIPLDLRSPYGLAVLSCIINSTPGSVWVEVLPDSHDLAVHVFDLQDEQWWIETIKTRYEQPLREIFGEL